MTLFSSRTAKSLIVLTILLSVPKVFAYQAFLNTGEILPQGQFQLTGYLETIFDEFDGVNLNGRGTMSVSDELQVDVELGFGEFDIYLGGFVKWVPIPDYEKQPALGIRGGLSYVKIDDFNETSGTIAPFASKSFETEVGPFTPFAALPFGVANHSDKNPNDDDTFFTAKLALGTEWMNPEWHPNFRVIGELNIELTEAFTSFNVGASYRF